MRASLRSSLERYRLLPLPERVDKLLLAGVDRYNGIMCVGCECVCGGGGVRDVDR